MGGVQGAGLMRLTPNGTAQTLRDSRQHLCGVGRDLFLLRLSLERDKEPGSRHTSGFGGRKRRSCQRGTGRQQTRVGEAEDGLIPSPSSDLLPTTSSPPQTP